jgi:nitroreductase
MTKPVFEPFEAPFDFDREEMVARAKSLLHAMRKRRTVRDFDDESVPMEVIEDCLAVAATAPSGANRQPWHFVVVTSPEVKAQIREAAEREERAFYADRAPSEWLEALEFLGTDSNKPFLESAPVLIAIFARNYDVDADGTRTKNYYVQESVGIATGMLLSALHLSGLSTLTHTPSPMNFLNGLLNRPKHERAYLLLVVGHSAVDARVPKITKKSASEVVSYI